MSTILPYGPGPGEWDTIRKLLQSAANWDFANGQKMTLKGSVCGNVANASSVQGNGSYSKTGFVGGIEWVGPTGPIHSTYTSQSFGCQWFTVLPPECPSPPNEPSDQLFVDIATASNTAKQLTPTQTFAGIDTSGGNVVINVVSGLNVINVPPNPFGTTEGKLQVRGNGDLIINGPADAVVIFNVGADDEVNAVRNGMSVENGRSILLTGGVQAQNVLFNVLGGDLLINGGDINGNFLVRAGSDDKGKATIQGTTLVNGIVIGDGNHSSEFLLDTNASICNAFTNTPSIEVKKQVSPDNGVTWFDADTPTGPVVLPTTNPQFRFIVTNIGNVALTNVIVTDNVFPGNIIGPVNLQPGESQTAIIIGTWALGQHENTATATGEFDGEIVEDTDPAFWVGSVASIDVEKEVSPDNGVTWFDADTPPGPNVLQGTNPQFRFTVTNDGLVTLTNVIVTDDVFGLIAGPIPSLAPGASLQFFAVGVWAAGQHVNTATATGDFEGQVVTDTDQANWFGAEPIINVLKEVSPDNGVTWFDADVAPGPNVPQGINPQFRFTVSNIGNVTLANVVVTDNVLPGIIIGPIPSMDPGDVLQTIVVGAWAAGQQMNTATATGEFEGETITDTNDAFWFGEEGPAINVLKEVSPDNGITWFDANTPPGPNVAQGTNPQFRFTVTNIGNVPLTNVVVTDDVLPGIIIGPIPILLPGQQQQTVVIGVWAPGQQVNNATATGDFEGQTVTDTDPAFWFGVIAPEPAIDVTKEVSPDNGITWFDANTPPGPNVAQGTNPQFRFTVTNTGNVPLTNVVVTDDVLPGIIIGPIPILLPGQQQQTVVIGAWALGQQVNTATATGTFDGQQVTDTDPAFWFGISGPSIDIEKFVSVDNGVTWIDADTPPGPLLPPGVTPQFRFVVTNNGSVPLTNIVVNDDVFGLIGTVPSLNPGDNVEFIIP